MPIPKTLRSLLAPAAVAVVALFGSACTEPAVGGGSSYNPVAYRPHNSGNVRVKVSLDNRCVYVMEGDKALLVAATTIGIPAKPTPKGNFRIYNKIAQKRSGSYGFRVQANAVVPAEANKPVPGRYVGYPMAYWCEFAPAYGFHEGYVWPTPRSHGCLRLHHNVAVKFFALVKNGTPVSIANSQPEDATIGKDLNRPTDYNDPDPAASYMVSSKVFEHPSNDELLKNY